MATTISKTNKEMTLLQAIERVVELAEDSKLSKEFMKKAKAEILLLAKSYGITERQAVLFCVCMEKGPRRVDYDDLASFLNLNKISVLSYASDIDALVRRRLLKFRDVKDEDDFDIPSAVIRCLKHNEVYQLPKRTGLDCSELFELLDMWFEDLDDNAISPKELREELEALFKDNPQIGFVRHLKEYYLRDSDQLLVTFFCHCLINKDDDDIRFSQMEDLFDSKNEFSRAKGALRCGDHRLMEKKLIEHRCEDGIADNTRYKLTESAKRTLLAEMNINVSTEKLADVLDPKTLGEKQLFFPKDIQRQVEELGRFLQPDNFQKIQERMKENGFRNGFACLFYGSPGTGKTETVYQLARHDAIIGIRKNGAQSAVDKMENSIQNIILQEMETLDGIMIATTNLQQNMDKAFERRFLYKIKFDKPTEEARASIWHSMIPDLSELDVHTLASKYDFSGGQIENIARHYAIDTILHGQNEDMLPMLIRHCDNERLDQRDSRKIGFS